MKMLCHRFIVLYMATLIIGNIFQYEPTVYVLLALSVGTIFFGKHGILLKYLKQYTFIIGLALYGIIIALLSGGGFGGPVTIITGLMVCYAAQEIKFDKIDIMILTVALMISILYWLYHSPGYYDEFMYNQWKGDGTLTNSNGVGHYLAYECSYMIIILRLSSKKWVKFFRWILTLSCIWGCYNVRARMALVTLLLFLIMEFVIENFSKLKRSLIKTFLIGSILFEIVFPFIYLWMYQEGIGSNITMFGLTSKGLYTGREDIWNKAFSALDTFPQILFGIGSRHDFWEGHPLNMHNNAMNLLVVIGLVGLIIYFSYLIYYITTSFDFRNASKSQWLCLIFFTCIIFEGTTDITLFYNNFLAYYFIPLGVALSKNYYQIGNRL